MLSCLQHLEPGDKVKFRYLGCMRVHTVDFVDFKDDAKYIHYTNFTASHLDQLIMRHPEVKIIKRKRK